MSEEEPPKPETFRGHLPALAGSVLGTLIATIISGHFFGKEGTKYALIAGSCISGSASWWVERVIRRAHTVAQAKLKAQREKGRPLSLEETQMIEAVHKASFNWRFRGIHYRTIFLLVLAAFIVPFLTVFGLDSIHRTSNDFIPPVIPTVTRTTYQPPTVYAPPPSTVYISPSIRLTQTKQPTTVPSSNIPSPSVTPDPSSSVPSPSPSAGETTFPP